ncbi:hypothetical protein FRC07_011773, partial [Ceratobasidium sp. 392]
IQMHDMYKEQNLWHYITNSQAQPVITAGVTAVPATATTAAVISVSPVTQADIDAWDTRKRQVLGLLRRRCEEGPIRHIATATKPHTAWNTLQLMYEHVGTSAMTLSHQKFYGHKMVESDDLEEHLKTMQKLHDQINLALIGQNASTITEVKFIEQVVTSLPESYDMLVSMVEFSFNPTTNPLGIQMSQNIQTCLLNKATRRKTRQSEGTSFYTNTRRNNGNNGNNHDSQGRFLPQTRTIDCTKKPGGGAYQERRSPIDVPRTTNKAMAIAEGTKTMEDPEIWEPCPNEQSNEHWGPLPGYLPLPKGHVYIVSPNNIALSRWQEDQVASIDERIQTIFEESNNAELHLDEETEDEAYPTTVVDTVYTLDPLYIDENKSINIFNLISLSLLTNQNNNLRIKIKKDLMIFINKKTNRHFATALKLGDCSSGNHWHLIATAHPRQYAYVLTRTLKDWHQILGHIDPRHILKMEKQQTALGLHIDKKKPIEPGFECMGCLKGKST